METRVTNIDPKEVGAATDTEALTCAKVPCYCTRVVVRVDHE